MSYVFNPFSGKLDYYKPVTASGVVVVVATGTVNGTNTAFTFPTAPNVIVVDQGRVMQKVSSDGSVNWTGTTSVTLSVAPNFDIFGM